jgi:7-cyano-7-deazaguanine synthase
VLLSAGLDSAVLAASEARVGEVHPVYVSTGLAWERAELDVLRKLLAASPLAGRTASLATLAFPVGDLYPSNHWALRGAPPAFDTPDEDVYLTGRNVALLSKAAIYCAQQKIGRIVLGPLAGNPFPDATPAFFAAMARALTLGLDHDFTIDAPFASMDKREVVKLGVDLGVPFQLTLSCMNPYRRDGSELPEHCGRCSKCRERRDAFADAGEVDPTVYATPPLR